MEIVKITKNGERVLSVGGYELNEKRVVRLTGKIDSELADKIIGMLEYLDDISDDDIYVYINSPGGSVTDGMAIIDAVGRLRSKVNYIAQGQAYSMAAFILASGEKGYRKATPNSEIMLHQVLGGASGQASDVELEARHIQKEKVKINSLLAKWTGKKYETIVNDTDRNYFLDAKEALDYGIIDEILC